jgi:hypothetical protein
VELIVSIQKGQIALLLIMALSNFLYFPLLIAKSSPFPLSSIHLAFGVVVFSLKLHPFQS